MPKLEGQKVNQNIPLPPGWEMAQDMESGRIFYVDHINKKTQWIDPRDRFVKPLTFADCIGDELPYGWEVAFDPTNGVYYIDHVRKRNQLEDPRIEWRNLQINMLNNYLQQANCDDILKTGNSITSSTSLFNPSTYSSNNVVTELTKSNMKLNNETPLTNSSTTSIHSENDNRVVYNNLKLSECKTDQQTNKVFITKIYDKAILERSLAESKARVAQLKRELDANYNLLTIIDKYYKKDNNSDANAVEV